jgi:hypothetical protein
MSDQLFKRIVVGLLFLIATDSVFPLPPHYHEFDFVIRDEWDMEFSIRDHYRDGYRLVAVEHLIPESAGNQKKRPQYALIFEK